MGEGGRVVGLRSAAVSGSERPLAIRRHAGPATAASGSALRHGVERKTGYAAQHNKGVKTSPPHPEASQAEGSTPRHPSPRRMIDAREACSLIVEEEQPDITRCGDLRQAQETQDLG
jgi:hypothetical protein